MNQSVISHGSDIQINRVDVHESGEKALKGNLSTSLLSPPLKTKKGSALRDY